MIPADAHITRREPPLSSDDSQLLPSVDAMLDAAIDFALEAKALAEAFDRGEEVPGNNPHQHFRMSLQAISGIILGITPKEKLCRHRGEEVTPLVRACDRLRPLLGAIRKAPSQIERYENEAQALEARKAIFEELVRTRRPDLCVLE